MAQQVRATGSIEKVDPLWGQIRDEAEQIVRKEPELATFIYSTVLHHDSLEAAVVHRVAERLDSNVSMLHGVTLGGTGKDAGDRHPKISRGVLIGAGAKILG